MVFYVLGTCSIALLVVVVVVVVVVRACVRAGKILSGSLGGNTLCHVMEECQHYGSGRR